LIRPQSPLLVKRFPSRTRCPVRSFYFYFPVLSHSPFHASSTRPPSSSKHEVSRAELSLLLRNPPSLFASLLEGNVIECPFLRIGLFPLSPRRLSVYHLSCMQLSGFIPDQADPRLFLRRLKTSPQNLLGGSCSPGEPDSNPELSLSRPTRSTSPHNQF